MKKISVLLGVFLISCLLCAAEKPAANVPAAKKKEVKTQVAEDKSSKVIVDNFEEAKTKWLGFTYISNPEGQEQTAEDTLKLSVNSDEKYVKSGKQSLKIEYATNPASKNKFAMVSFTSAKPMGENDSLSFWINKAKGKSSLEIALFDDKWKKSISQPIPLADGGKVITLKRADFTAAPKWENMKVIQITIRGDAVLYLDDVKFTKAD